MAKRSARSAKLFVILLLGMGVLVLAGGGHLAGYDRRAENVALDLRFRIRPQTHLNEDLLLVLLDDTALEKLGRWPWPRQTQAGLYQILTECGASALALDIVLPDAQPVRYVSDRWDVYAAEAELVGTAPAQPVFDDELLRQALSRAPRVVLPIVINPGPAPELSPGQRRLASIMNDLGDLPLATVAHCPALRAADLDRRDLAKLYLRHRATSWVREHFALWPLPRDPIDPPAGTVIPPLVPLAQQADTVGFVTFDPDEDGVLRRIHLLMESHQGGTYAQMGLALAAVTRGQGAKPTSITAGPDELILEWEDRKLRVPVDSAGGMLVPWLHPDKIPDNARMSLAEPGLIWLDRQSLEHNLAFKRLLREELARQLGHQDLIDAFRELRRLEQQAIEIEFARQHQRLYAPMEEPQARPEDPTGQIAGLQRRIDRLSEELADPFYLQGLAEDDPLRLGIQRLLARLDEIDQANADLRESIDKAMDALGRRVGGKICLIGAQSTALGDFVPTPTAKRTPGVYVHANVFSAIANGDYITIPGAGWNLAAIAAVGLIATLLSARLPIVWASVGVLALLGIYAAVNAYVLFAWRGVWLAMVSPLSAGAGAFVVVTAYRELTEERAKRQIRTMFSHTISPGMVDRLLDNPNLASLGGGERRVLTFLFSDLQGFTNLVERIGETKAVRILNRYFDRITEVVETRHGGYLNKFLGDGAFAMFGAPVPREDHARRGLRAALDCCREINTLTEEMPEAIGIEAAISCRIGVSTGDVMIGNCGSSDRWDISAIGDAVNLASRLEGANKMLGTRNLVADATWRAAGAEDEILARPIGFIQVVGRHEPVFVWNLMAPRDRATDEMVDLARRFAEALGLFRDRRFQAAADLFGDLAQAHPRDIPSWLFRERAREAARQDPQTGWSDVLVLDEKGQ